MAACAPALNWRAIGLDHGAGQAWLPCKPDEATRAQQIGDQRYDLHLQGCEAGGGLFALAALALPAPAEPARVRELQSAWEHQWADRLQAANPTTLEVHVKGADWSRALQACGQAPGGDATCSIALWFGRGTALFQAVAYAPQTRLGPDVREAFWGGIELR